MRVSGFTFVRNGTALGYPFIESIQSILPICDEFIVNVGESEDDTLECVRSIDSRKIRIIESVWNPVMRVKGYTYGQQKMIAQFNCTGDWAFYLEADEVVHESELSKITASMETHLSNDRVEALVFDYLHFYGNAETYAWSPGWYRTAPRIIRNSIRTNCPDALFWTVMKRNKTARYPRAAHTGATIYHYGWVRSEPQMNLKSQQVQQYWNKSHHTIDYTEIDQYVLRQFKGSHPEVMRSWLPHSDGLFQANPNHRLTRKERRTRLMLKLEEWFGFDLSKKHHKPVR